VAGENLDIRWVNVKVNEKNESFFNLLLYNLEVIIKSHTFAVSEHMFWLSGKFPRGSKT
jgi:hypothetical protein